MDTHDDGLGMTEAEKATVEAEELAYNLGYIEELYGFDILDVDLLESESYYLPSSELSWLSRHFKQYYEPLLLVADRLFFSGCYFRPDYNYPKGMILTQNASPSTIAHEYRHHLQYCKCPIPFRWDPNLLGTPEYWYQPHEHDALMFESRMHPDESNEYFRNLARIGRYSRMMALSYIA